MTTIRRLITFAILASTFLGGYYLGRSPNSPDIIGWIGDQCKAISKAGQSFTATVDEQASRLSKTIQDKE